MEIMYLILWALTSPTHMLFVFISFNLSSILFQSTFWFPLGLTPGCFSSHSQDLEDPELRGGSAGRRCVHAEHLPERTATQPRAARVHPLHPPAHPYQGPHVRPLRRVAVDPEAPQQTDVILFCFPSQPAEVPLGRWNQKSVPQRSRERAS